mgnify:CR=1 FL=1
MRVLKLVIILLLGLSLAACSSKFRNYNGPKVTSIQVHKADRKMYLLHEGKVLKTYKIALGGVPVGHKQFEGDGKTPEGTYFISHRNPTSTYHLSLGVSYPNDDDRAFAKANGKQPGGDIMIHGGPKKKVGRKDWTAGCIAVTDRQIEDVYAMVTPGTPIYILP